MLSSAFRITVLLVIGLGMLRPVPAQSDPQTEDWSQQDRKYMERIKKADEREEPGDKNPEAIREQYLKQTIELIRDKNYAVEKTEYFLIRTDDPRLDLEAAGDLLERFREFFVRFWEIEPDSVSTEEKSEIFLFYSYYKFNKIVTGRERFDDFRPAGHYRPDRDLITLHSDGSPLDELPGTLVHEATHQLVEKILFGGRTPRPIWLDEGLANYFGFTGLKTMGESSRSIEKDRKKSNPRGSRTALAALKRALSDKQDPFSVIDLLDMNSPMEYYGDRIRVHYAASWALVHYLLHGEDGRYREPFTRMLQEDPTIAGDAERLMEVLNGDEASFVTGFENHIKNIKP